MTIRKKLFLIFGGFVICIILSVILMDKLFLEDYYLYRNKSKMNELGNEIEVEYYINEDNIQEMINRIGNTWNINARIATADYKIKYSTLTNEKDRLSDVMIEKIKENEDSIMENGYQYINFYNDEDEISRLAYIKTMGNHKFLILTKSLITLEENANISNQFFIISSLIFTVFGLIAIWLFTRYLSNSIGEISSVAKDISNLNFTNKVNIKQTDELGDLANSINEISDKLNKSISNLKSDIEIRKDLVRDISHEIKIPIAAVKGYAEGLKYAVADNPKKMEKYCDVIVNECDKMDEIVKSMLEVSQMENMEKNLDKKPFKLFKLRQGIYNRFSYDLESNHIDFSIHGTLDEVIVADYSLVEQAVFNFIENAVRYTPEYGRIIVDINVSEGIFYVNVFNSGSYISEEELEKIWEVFYKVDKARTRNELRNYGVGLAIVKSIAKLHEGNVCVKNLEDGIQFCMSIPIRTHIEIEHTVND